MEKSIELIAQTPILINSKNDDLCNIFEKIILWVNLIKEYGELLKGDYNYKNQDLTKNDDFTFEMKIASLGSEYKNWKISPSSLHETGELWSFEQMVIASNTGLVEWYCNKFGYSNDKYLKICDNIDIQILGAFYHRMKIILENVYKIIDYFKSGKKYGMFDINIIDKLLLKKDLDKKNKKLYELCTEIKKIKK